MDRRKQTRQVIQLCIALVIVTLAIYWPTLDHGFINYDDPDYVTTNETVQKGLTREGITWAFTTGHASNWHPVTWLSHMLDSSLFGMKPMGHHGTNLLFHVANSVLLLLLLYQLTGAVWRSALVAFLFAIHPLHVESVAWVAERKDVLSTFFGLLCLMAYSAYAKSKTAGQGAKVSYALAVTFLALGLMSKPMLVTWPFVMLLLDFWPLRRIEFSPFNLQTLKKLLLEKIPLIILVFISCWITIHVQRGAMAETTLITFDDRVCNALLAYVDYLQQTIWPTRLAVFYPRPTSFSPLKLPLVVAILGGITFAAMRSAKPRPFGVVGWLWFLGTLVPVIGLIQVGAQARADRYTYVPLIGIFIVISWSLAVLASQSTRSKWIVVSSTTIALIAAGFVSRFQIGHWKDDRTLCTHAAEVTSGNYMAWGGLGILDVKATDWASAMTNLTRAYEYAIPHHTERSVQYYIGVALQMQGKPLEALPHLQECIVSAEMKPERDYRLGLSLIEAGRPDEAEVALNEAIKAKPQKVEYHLGMAALWVNRRDMNKAEPIYRDMLAMYPKSAVAHKAYADFLMLAKRPVEAEPLYEAAVNLKPADAGIRRAYALALQAAGKNAEAAAQLEEIYNRQPAAPEAFELAELLATAGQPENAVIWYDKTIAADPNHLGALNNLAWLLSTHPKASVRNGTRAVTLAEKAVTITDGKQAVVLGTLAAAYAEAGRFSDAVATADKAIAQANKHQQADIAKRNAELRGLYANKLPYREK